jgi:transposase-like protein
MKHPQCPNCRVDTTREYWYSFEGFGRIRHLYRCTLCESAYELVQQEGSPDTIFPSTKDTIAKLKMLQNFHHKYPKYPIPLIIE